MTELALHLTEEVIPYVPVRQFVLSLPHRLRYLLAYDHARSLGVLRVVLRAVFGFYRPGAKRGTAADGRTGSVTFVQRFGSAGNLNLHYHILVLDGVFTEARDHCLRFHPAEAPTDEAIAQLLATIRRRVLRHLARCAPSEDAAELLSLALFHRLCPRLFREPTAVESLIARTSPRLGGGDGKRSAGAIVDAITPAPV